MLRLKHSNGYKYEFLTTIHFIDGDADLGQRLLRVETTEDPSAGGGEEVVKELAKEMLIARNELQAARNASRLLPAIKKGVEKFL